MVDSKTIKEQIIFKEEKSVKIYISSYSISDLISNASWPCAIRPYIRANGSDANSLRYKLIKQENCVVDEDAFEFSYNFNKKEAVLYLDKSKITPNADSGKITVKLSGNYNFIKCIEIPWKIKKIDIVLSVGDIEIVKNNIEAPNCENPENLNCPTVTWKNGNTVELLSFKIHCPKDVEKNGFWYKNVECPKITLDYSPTFLGNNLEFYINNSNNKFEYDEEYKIKCRCNYEIDRTAFISNLRLSLKSNDLLLLSENISLNFTPQCIVTKNNNVNRDSYILGDNDSKIIDIFLKNNAHNGGPKAKIWITFTCDESYRSLFVLNITNKYIEINPRQSETITVSLNKELLKTMPENDITATLKLEAGNGYTIFDKYEEIITLKKQSNGNTIKGK